MTIQNLHPNFLTWLVPMAEQRALALSVVIRCSRLGKIC